MFCFNLKHKLSKETGEFTCTYLFNLKLVDYIDIDFNSFLQYYHIYYIGYDMQMSKINNQLLQYNVHLTNRHAITVVETSQKR